jgi:4-hydroxybenzoate polyprenyltransferase
MNIVSKYASLVKFQHTVFAMPFALMSYVAASHAVTWESGAPRPLLDLWVDGFSPSATTPFGWLLLLRIVLCMMLARNAAMSFNRIVDRDIDARNPRTQGRELPSGGLGVKAAGWFCAVNGVLFVVVAATINRLTWWLAPVALLVILGYSYTKRITSWSHIVLGFALAIAPVGAWIAVRGNLAVFPIVVAGVVLTWVAGFDVVYSLQDREFDKRERLRSVPARFSVGGSLAISIAFHAVSVGGVILLGHLWLPGTLYRIGAIIFTASLAAQHLIVTPHRRDRIAATFTTVNGVASIAYSLLAVAAILTGG